MQNDALMSYAAGRPLYFLTGDKTHFVNISGLAGQQAGKPNLCSRDLVFKDQSQGPDCGKPVVVAGQVIVLP